MVSNPTSSIGIGRTFCISRRLDKGARLFDHELDARLRAGLGSDAQVQSPEQAETLAAIAEAQPFVAAAEEQLLLAASDLSDENLQGAVLGQYQGLRSLEEARERFLDLAGLIEAAYADQHRIASVLASQNALEAEVRSEYLPSLRVAQDENRKRGDRLGAKLAAEAQKIQSAAEAPDPSGAPPDEEAIAAQAQRMEVAGRLLQGALGGMEAVRDELGGDARGGRARPVTAEGWGRAADAAATALSHLEELRRLFFSIAQLVRELAERQTGLADLTQDAMALAADPDRDAGELAAPFAGAQGELAARTLQIANALVEQADAPPPEGQEGAEEAAAKLRMAAEHVVLAQAEMEGATTALGAAETPTGAPPPDPPSDPVAGSTPRSALADQPARAIEWHALAEKAAAKLKERPGDHRRTSAYNLACAYAGAKKPDEAFAALYRSYEGGEPVSDANVSGDKRLESLRRDERWHEFWRDCVKR